MLIVPLSAVPNQAVTITLGGQSCQVNVYKKFYGLFIDVLVDNEPIIQGVICQNKNRIVRDAYLGFIGDFEFLDNQGSDDPTYTGLGQRFSLCYLEASDLAAGVAAIGSP